MFMFRQSQFTDVNLGLILILDVHLSVDGGRSHGGIMARLSFCFKEIKTSDLRPAPRVHLTFLGAVFWLLILILILILIRSS